MDERWKRELPSILAELTSSSTNGDAWTRLYHFLRPYVYGLLFRLLRGHRDLAEDLCQEVFLKLARYCPFKDLLDPLAFRSYLWTICRNTARSYLKRLQKSKLEAENTGAPPIELGSATDPEASSLLEAKETLAQILEKVEPVDAQILRSLIEGQSLSEIASHTGRKYSDVAVRLFRLRERLRSLFSS